MPHYHTASILMMEGHTIIETDVHQSMIARPLSVPLLERQKLHASVLHATACFSK